jgi:hypothetical protein
MKNLLRRAVVVPEAKPAYTVARTAVQIGVALRVAYQRLVNERMMA